MTDIENILEFWFGELSPAQWFKKDPALDQDIRCRFLRIYEKLKRGVPPQWRRSPLGVLAAVIVLDQFPRNMFRDQPQAFATDDVALSLAEEVIESGGDLELTTRERQFLYMPFQHAEDLEVQNRSLELFERLGDKEVMDFAQRHHEIIARFGRFPHRNAVLDRASTPEEQAYLATPGAGF